jgi:hypothetical protein
MSYIIDQVGHSASGSGGPGGAFYIHTSSNATGITVQAVGNTLTQVSANFGSQSTWGGYASINISLYFSITINTVSSGTFVYNSTSNGILTSNLPAPVPFPATFIINFSNSTTDSITGTNSTASGNYTYTVSPASGQFNFVNTSVPKSILLPQPSLAGGELLFIKDSTNNASNQPITVTSPTGSLIDGNQQIILNGNRACLSLFSYQGNWKIANNFSGGTRITDSTGAIPVGTAVAGTLNTVASRPTKSVLTLPAPVSGALLPVVFTTAPSNASAVCFVGGSNSIDNYYTTTGAPFLDVNVPGKTEGCLFISDGSTWFLVGIFDDLNWTFQTVPNEEYNPPVNLIATLFNVKPESRNNLGVDYFLPSADCMIIQKMSSAESQKMNYFGNFNQGNKQIWYPVGQNYHCVWFIVAGGVSYPLMAYTP